MHFNINLYITTPPISDSNQPLDSLFAKFSSIVPNYFLIYSQETTIPVIKMKITPAVIFALFVCLSQLVASEDGATTKDINARNEDINNMKSK